MDENVVNSDDAGMIERRGQLRLAKQSSFERRVRRFGLNDLDGDIALQAAVMRLVDDPHASGSYDRLDLVRPESRPRDERHRAGFRLAGVSDNAVCDGAPAPGHHFHSIQRS